MDDSRLEEVFLSSESIFEGHIIHVEKWQVRLPDGSVAPREIVRHRGAAAVVPVDENGYVTLVRQYRCPIHRCTWEIPAGKLDHDGEDMLEAATRELSEETGLKAEKMELLTDLQTTVGFCDEHIGIYLATGLSQHEMHLDPDEFLNVAKLPLSEAVQRVISGEIRDSKTVAGLLLAWQKLQTISAVPFESFTTTKRTSAAFTSRSK